MTGRVFAATPRFASQTSPYAAAQLTRARSTYLQSKECHADEDRGEHADQVDEQHCAQCVAGILDLHTPEVNGDDVERRFRCALKDATEAAGEGVRAVRIHRVEQKSAASGRVEWPKNCDWQRIHDLIAHVNGAKRPRQRGREHLKKSTVSEKRDRDKHSKDVRENDAPDC